jgi:hypothetical protein
MTDKTMTLADLIAETYTADEAKWFVYCDAGDGSSYGESGEALPYTPDCAAHYGHLVMHPTPPHVSADRVVECAWASEWIETGSGYRYRVRF